MTIEVSSRGITQVKQLTVDKTKVKRVTVGRPVRKINEATSDISNIRGIDMTGAEDGSVLVWNSSEESFECTTVLENTDINGGQY